MSLENWLSQMGIGTKHITDRYAEYPSAGHDVHQYYAYEPSLPSYGHGSSSKHHYSGSGNKGNAAMSALTLLAFLFFLHILQQCLKEHMTAMSTPQVMVVSAGREEQSMAKLSSKDKSDKSGVLNDLIFTTEVPRHQVGNKNKINDQDNAQYLRSESNENFLTKIETAEHTPQKTMDYKNIIKHYSNKSSVYADFVSAMDEN